MADTIPPMFKVTWDGTGEHWTVNVEDTDGTPLLNETYPEWTGFRPASAGHRLIEHGFMPRADDYYRTDTVACWTEVEPQRLYTGEVHRIEGFPAADS